MSKKLKLLSIFFSLVIIAETTLVYYLYTNPRTVHKNNEIVNAIYTSDKTERDLELERLKAVQPDESENVFITGWIPDWDFTRGVNTVKDRPGVFNGISPFWFTPNENGSLKSVPSTNNAEFIAYCKANDIELIPTIFSFDHVVLSKVLNNEENFARHIDEIVNQVVDNNYDGIDLDYESIYLKDKVLFFDFLKELSLKLKIHNKKLVFTAMPKWGDTFNYSGLPQTRMVQDYAEISKYVDEFRLMTYEFTGKASTKVGPTAPLEWMKEVIQYSIDAGVPRHKLVLGVHNYVYDWSEREIEKDIRDGNNFRNILEFTDDPADAYFYSSIADIKNKYDLKTTYHEEWGETIGEYMFEGKKRIAIYLDDQGIEARKDLANKYGIKGIAIWRVGDEGDLKY